MAKCFGSISMDFYPPISYCDTCGKEYSHDDVPECRGKEEKENKIKTERI